MQSSKAICLISAVLLSGLAFDLARRTYRLEIPISLNDYIVADSDTLALGEVLATDDFSWTLRIFNRSDRAAHLKNVQASCQCTTIEPSELTIDAGGAADLSIKINLSSQLSGLANSQQFEVTVSATAVVGTATGHLRWPLRGIVHGVFHFDPDAVALSWKNEGATARVRFQVLEDLRDIAVAPIRMSRSARGGKIDCMAVLDSPRTGHVNLRAVEANPTGDDEWAITVRGTTTANRTVSGTIPVRILTDSPFRISPASVVVGRLAVGLTKADVIVIQHRQGLPFTLESVSSSAEGLMATPTNGVKSTSTAGLSFAVEKHVLAAGTQIDTVTITLSTQDGQLSKIPLKVVTVGYDP